MKSKPFIPMIASMAAFFAAILIILISAKSHEESLTADLNADGKSEVIRLKRGRLEIRQANDFLWSSPKEWQVKAMALGDSNNDGLVEINLSVWKPGSYGQYQPFWIKQKDETIKNHLFVLRLESDKTLKRVWQSSNLDKPICALQVKDVDGNGQQEIVVSEGDYADGLECEPWRQTIWEWKMWNFFKVE